MCPAGHEMPVTGLCQFNPNLHRSSYLIACLPQYADLVASKDQQQLKERSRETITE